MKYEDEFANGAHGNQIETLYEFTYLFIMLL